MGEVQYDTETDRFSVFVLDDSITFFKILEKTKGICDMDPYYFEEILVIRRENMGKNTNLINSLENVSSSYKDEIFKDIFRYKCIAALIIKYSILEYQDLDVVDIAKLIVDYKTRGKLTEEEIMNDEIDLLQTEIGTGSEKNTISDIVFCVKTLDGSRYNKITVNLEMQTSKPKEYSLISRAIYYGASLLRNTVPAADTNYTNIHKVYSVWLCTKDIINETVIEIQNRYIHRYNMRRNYPDITDKVCKAEDEADLIEVIIIELNKLRKHMNKDIDRIIYNLIYSTNTVAQYIEQQTKVNLTKFRKAAFDMVDKIKYGEALKAEGIAEGKAEGLAEGFAEGKLSAIIIAMTKSKSKGKEYCIRLSKELLGATDEEINKAIKEVFGS